MVTPAIHRVVEEHAAIRGDAVSLVDGARALSYRELNLHANACARHLLACGFRRGSHAVVRMPRGVQLAVVLLGVLKAGGSYSWSEGVSGESNDASLQIGERYTTDRFITVDVSGVLAENVHPSPNLPILTRGSDIACVLSDTDGMAAVLVPHATVTTLSSGLAGGAGQWIGEAGALDLWLGLVTGATVTVAKPQMDWAA